MRFEFETFRASSEMFKIKSKILYVYKIVLVSIKSQRVSRERFQKSINSTLRAIFSRLVYHHK